MSVLLEQINKTTKQLQSRFNSLTGEITEVKSNLSTTCSLYPKNCSDNINSSSITTVANFNNLPNVEEQLNNISAIAEKNLTNTALQVSLNPHLISLILLVCSLPLFKHIVNQLNERAHESVILQPHNGSLLADPLLVIYIIQPFHNTCV